MASAPLNGTGGMSILNRGCCVPSKGFELESADAARQTPSLPKLVCLGFKVYNTAQVAEKRRLPNLLLSQGEKPPKIRKKSSQEQSSWELLDLLPLKRQRK